MCVTRLVPAYFAAIMSVLGAPQVAGAGEEIMLRAGEAAGPNAVLAIDNGAKPRQIIVRTTQAGVAGSRIEVTIDKAKTPAFSHIFTTQECKFDDGGSKCEVVIPASNAAYAAILAQFKRGRVGHIIVADAGVMMIDQTVSLLGFSKTLRAGRRRTQRTGDVVEYGCLRRVGPVNFAPSRSQIRTDEGCRLPLIIGLRP